MESNRALTTICILLCLFLSASFFSHSVDARKLVRFEKDSKKKPKKLIIKAFKHTTLLEKMMTQLNLAQPLEYSTTSSNTQPYGVSTTLTLPPYASLPPLPVPGNAPPFCVNPPNTPLNSPPSISNPGLSPPHGPITVPNPPESSSNPNSNPNPPDSTSNPNSNPNPPESSSNPNSNPNPPDSTSNPNSNPNPPDSSSNPNPPVTIPSPPESSSNPNPPESSSNPNPPVTVPYPPESSSPNPPETVPSPPESGSSPSGPISGPPNNEPGPSTPTNTPTPSGNLPSPTGSVPTPSSGFLPPIVYPPPMVPPPSTATPTSAYWCVAKPTVPDPIIQEAMNFACGSGADCHSIQPNGPCFKPNTLWAHASFAFNSYWQRTKSSGGSCTFGGTGMLVTVDPSYNGCHFDFF